MKKLYPLLLVIFSVILMVFLWLGQGNNLFTVTFFDIGQGDAALIQTPQNQFILIDGGPDRSILDKLGKYLPWTERKIDLVVLSHPHADHVAGLNHVLERYQVGQVLMTGVLHTTPEYIKFLSLLKEKNILVTIADKKKTFTFGGGVTLLVLRPDESIAESRVTDLNETSIVNKVVYGNTSILFTGDISTDNELTLIEKKVDLTANILKVAHQGSKTSSSEAFIKAASPQVAVISVGKNSYGHPNKEIVDRLKSLINVVLRTDQEGDITFISDGQAFWRQ